MSVIDPVQSHYREGSQKKSKVGRICWKGRFWAWSEIVKQWWMMRARKMREMACHKWMRIRVSHAQINLCHPLSSAWTWVPDLLWRKIAKIIATVILFHLSF